ncbi:hypothetical protein OG21DRAFT_1489238 [Imleria badia]|nr:hypothetical protein OG21DRAFT_1489238 [Imleria badia]
MDLKMTREMAECRATRQNLVWTANCSKKIRMYNYAQVRITDHHIGLLLTNLQLFMEGTGVQEFLDAMRRHWEEERMEKAD